MSEPQELVEAALAATDADGCVAICAEHTETNLRWANNSLTTNGQMSGRSLTVVTTYEHGGGTSVGTVTRSVRTVDDVADLVRAAEAAGRDAAPAEDAAALVQPYEHHDDWDAPAARTSVEVFADFAPELGRACRDWAAADRLLYGFAEHEVTSYYLGVSTGLRRRFDQPAGRLELNGKTADLGDSTWSGQDTRDFGDVDIAATADALGRRLSWGRNRIDLDPGRYETLLPPTSTADLMVYAYWSASARDAEEGRNVYARGTGGTRIGERLTDLPLSLRSDPLRGGLECAPFTLASSSWGGVQSVFDNGQPVDAAAWIDSGVINDLVRTRAWAARSDQQPRPLVDNLILEADGADASLEDMVAATEQGLLITSLWYIREVDPQTLLLTGLTRDGVYLVENGEVRGRVNNFRFNESPIGLLGRASQVGASVPCLSREWSDDFRRCAMPPLRIPDFNMSTVSPAS